jgi:hypothetical protein
MMPLVQRVTRMRLGHMAVCCLLLWVLGMVAAHDVVAQGASAPSSATISIDVAKMIMCAPGGETSLSVTLLPAGVLPSNSFLRIKGLPSAATLSDGHRIAPGAWAIPTDSLMQLRVRALGAAQGRSELHFSLFSIEGRVLAEAKSSLMIGPPSLFAPTPPSPPPPVAVQRSPRTDTPSAQRVPAPPAISNEDRDQARRLLCAHIFTSSPAGIASTSSTLKCSPLAAK